MKCPDVCRSITGTDKWMDSLIDRLTDGEIALMAAWIPRGGAVHDSIRVIAGLLND